MSVPQTASRARSRLKISDHCAAFTWESSSSPVSKPWPVMTTETGLRLSVDTTVSPPELIAAKLLPLGIIKMVGLAVGIAIAVWGFGVPVHGSLGLYFALSTLAFIVSAGLGVAVGTVAKNMQQALLLSFFLLFPMIFLSGMMTPVFAMPQALQWLSLLNPMRYYNTITIGVFLKGVGIDVLWPQVAALAALGAVIFTASLAYFRRSLA